MDTNIYPCEMSVRVGRSRVQSCAHDAASTQPGGAPREVPVKRAPTEHHAHEIHGRAERPLLGRVNHDHNPMLGQRAWRAHTKIELLRARLRVVRQKRPNCSRRAKTLEELTQELDRREVIQDGQWRVEHSAGCTCGRERGRGVYVQQALLCERLYERRRASRGVGSNDAERFSRHPESSAAWSERL